MLSSIRKLRERVGEGQDQEAWLMGRLKTPEGNEGGRHCLFELFCPLLSSHLSCSE